MKNCAERAACGGIFHEKRRFFLALPQQRKKTPNKACYSSRTVTIVTDEPRFPCRKGLFFRRAVRFFRRRFLTVFFKNSRNNTIFFFACQPFEQNSREFFLNIFAPDSRFYPAEFCCFADAPRFPAEAVGGGTMPPVRAKRRRPFGGKCAQTSRT